MTDGTITSDANIPDNLDTGVKAGIDYAATRLPGIGNTQRTITLTRTETQPTDDQALWVAIRNRTKAIAFEQYIAFIDDVFCESGGIGALQSRIENEGCAEQPNLNFA